MKIEMLTPTDYSNQEEYDIAMRTLEILLREYDKGTPTISLAQILNEIGAPAKDADEQEEMCLAEENSEIAKLSVERFRATIH